MEWSGSFLFFFFFLLLRLWRIFVAVVLILIIVLIVVLLIVASFVLDSVTVAAERRRRVVVLVSSKMLTTEFMASSWNGRGLRQGKRDVWVGNSNALWVFGWFGQVFVPRAISFSSSLSLSFCHAVSLFFCLSPSVLNLPLSLSFCPYISNLLSNNLPVLLSRFDFGSRPEELVYALLAKNQDSLVDPRSVSADLRSTLCSTRFFHTPSSVAGNHLNPGGQC